MENTTRRGFIKDSLEAILAPCLLKNLSETQKEELSNILNRIEKLEKKLDRDYLYSMQAIKFKNFEDADNGLQVLFENGFYFDFLVFNYAKISPQCEEILKEKGIEFFYVDEKEIAEVLDTNSFLHKDIRINYREHFFQKTGRKLPSWEKEGK